MKELKRYALRVFALVAAVTLSSVMAVQVYSAERMALSGVVSSDKEPQMEGVLVKAKKVGGTITITVVSDDHGRYAFPADRLQPGEYRLDIWATGFYLADPGVVALTASKTKEVNLKLLPAEVDLKLPPARDLAAQLTDAEWVMSLPGEDADKKGLTCMAGCHEFAVPASTTYNATQLLGVIQLMHTFAAGATNEPAFLDERPNVNVLVMPKDAQNQGSPASHMNDQRLAEKLASINLSTSQDGKWNYPFKTFPRPTGESTKIITTEYDIPDRSFQPHDVVMGPDGMIYTTSFGTPYIGRLNPKTGAWKEWEQPVLKANEPRYNLDIIPDREGNMWVAGMEQGAVWEFDRKTETIKYMKVPAENANFHNFTGTGPYPMQSLPTALMAKAGATPQDVKVLNDNDTVHIGMVAARPDGKIWWKDSHNNVMYLMDPATWKLDGTWFLPHEFYGIRSDSRGDLVLSSVAKGTIGVIDAETGQFIDYPTPTPNSGAHRGEMRNDVYTFAESNAHKVAQFNTVTKQFVNEWPVNNTHTPWLKAEFVDPYDAIEDDKGYIWTAGIVTDYVWRVDPKTGDVSTFLLPTHDSDIRRMSTGDLKYGVANPDGHVRILLGEMHQARIAVMEPLDNK